jgi:hypothetical protein
VQRRGGWQCASETSIDLVPNGDGLSVLDRWWHARSMGRATDDHPALSLEKRALCAARQFLSTVPIVSKTLQGCRQDQVHAYDQCCAFLECHASRGGELAL